MDHRHLRALCMTGALMLGLGCDEEPSPPASPDVLTTAPGPTTQPTPVPVTEQIRKPMPLKLIPFSMQAPESWKVVSYGTGDTPITMIEGPIVGDEVRVSLGLRESVGGEVLRSMIKRMERDDAELKKSGTGSVTITDVGDTRIIDLRRKSPTAATQPSEQRMEWRVTLLHPRGVVHEQYTLQFIELSVESYEKNKALLSEIIQSIKYDDSEIAPLPKGF